MSLRFLFQRFLFSICVLPIAIDVHADEPTYRFTGNGTVYSPSNQGVVGESVQITFDFKLSDFSSPSTSVVTTLQGWYALHTIPVHAHGSITGDGFTVQPIGRMNAYQFSGEVGWDFETVTSDGNGYQSSIGAATSVNNITAIHDPIPKSLSTAFLLFYPEFTGGGIWTPYSYSGTFVAPDGSASLLLNNYTWTLTTVSVPEPSTLALLTIGVIAFAAKRRRADN